MWGLVGLAILAVLVLVLALRRRVPPVQGSPVSLCLVVRDQVDRVEGMVAELVALADALGARVADVVVVDEGSTDGTQELLALLQRRYPGIKTVQWSHDTERGGHALEAALELCGGCWILLRRAGAAVAPSRG
jgi:hypothetical protein